MATMIPEDMRCIRCGQPIPEETAWVMPCPATGLPWGPPCFRRKQFDKPCDEDGHASEPTGGRSQGDAAAPSDGVAASDFKDWQTIKAHSAMLRLQGTWVDQRGSQYTLLAGKDSYGLLVETIRPNRYYKQTEDLIHIEWKGELGRVVWGRGHPSS